MKNISTLQKITLYLFLLTVLPFIAAAQVVTTAESITYTEPGFRIQITGLPSPEGCNETFGMQVTDNRMGADDDAQRIRDCASISRLHSLIERNLNYKIKVKVVGASPHVIFKFYEKVIYA